jgi:formylglycine-generating enzyme required for sulfatase activity
MTTDPSLASILAELHAHAARTGDTALQERLRQLETALPRPAGSITVGDISGSTAVAIGSDIQIFVHQTTNLPADLLSRLLAVAEAFEQRGAATLNPAGHTMRLFLASPGDVKDERRLALKVIDKLRADPLYKARLTLEAVAWDRPDDSTPLLAGIDPQTAIAEGLARPSECDIVVALFWSRMGTPLDARRYAKPGGGVYLSGTEWELEDALQAFTEKGSPKVLIYRRAEEVLLNPNTRDFDERLRQWRLVQDFVAGFNNPDGSVRLAYHPYATPTEFGDLFEQHLRKVIAALIEARPPARPQPATGAVAATAAAASPAWPKDKSPFPGLRAFGPEDAPVFFGRGAETDQLLRRLADPACRFLAVVGASGSGKSSLVGAGLIPRLREGALPGSEQWPVIAFTPDAWGRGDPFDSLTGALLADPLRLPLHDLGRQLRAGPAGLRMVLEAHLARAPEWQRVVLFIDQFEETFTRVADETLRQTFCAALTEAAESARVLIVVTLRDDFYHYCVKSPTLSRLINRHNATFTLSAPAPLELHEMLAGPARVAEVQFEAGLARQILADTGADPGALALLAYALDQLYAAGVDHGRLTWAAYHALGGVQGAIGARAQAVFEGLPEAAQAALPRVFRELVEVDESGQATRKRARLERVQAEATAAQLVQALVAARLLVASRSAQGEALAEVAHEALFRSWPRLKGWIEGAQDDLILLRQVRAAAAWWDGHGRRAAYLWPDERLQPVYQMRQRLEPELNAVELEFIRLEFDRLMEEIHRPATSHRRRSAIGERLDTIGDRRPGVGVIQAMVPLRPRPASPHTAAELGPEEVRLWGDKAEHIGLPDIVWVKVDGGSIKIEAQTFAVEPFFIAKHPTTYNHFQAFVDAPDGFTDNRWWKGLAADKKDRRAPGEQNFKFGNNPRENVSWYDAIAFCRWLNARLGWPDLPGQLTPKTLAAYPGVRLLAEWEWQWAAAGGRSGYEYPWGPKWEGDRVNTSESGLGRTTAVGMYPAGAAPCGALDLSGNVWEWCLNENEKPGNLQLGGSQARVVRGGSWFNRQYFARAVNRYGYVPDFRFNFIGFRVGVRPPSL